MKQKNVTMDATTKAIKEKVMPESCYERVVGHPKNGIRIYIEDYVKSYLTGEIKVKPGPNDIIILFGDYHISYLGLEVKISGAAALRKIKRSFRKMTPEAEIQRMNLEYYPELEPVGWFCPTENEKYPDISNMLDVHEYLFGETKGIVVTKAPLSENFRLYSYSDDGFTLHDGYIIYYAKNTEMEDYITGRGKSLKSAESLVAITSYIKEEISFAGKRPIVIIKPFIAVITTILFLISIYKIAYFQINYDLGISTLLQYVQEYIKSKL